MIPYFFLSCPAYGRAASIRQAAGLWLRHTPGENGNKNPARLRNIIDVPIFHNGIDDGIGEFGAYGL